MAREVYLWAGKLNGGLVISKLPLEERPNIYKLYEANIKFR